MSETIVLSGAISPLDALMLRDALLVATAEARPHVTVDLEAVESLHISAIAALINAMRRCRRAGGDLHLIAPIAEEARAALALPGLLSEATVNPSSCC